MGAVGVILIPSSIWAFHLLGTHWCLFGLKSLLGELRTLAEQPVHYLSVEVIYCFPGYELRD